MDHEVLDYLNRNIELLAFTEAEDAELRKRGLHPAQLGMMPIDPGLLRRSRR